MFSICRVQSTRNPHPREAVLSREPPTIYREAWAFVQTAPAAMRGKLQHAIPTLDNVFLLRLRIAILFPLFIVIALRARRTEVALHKRMMILAIVLPL